MDLSVDVGGFVVKNPVIAASGVLGYGEEYARVGNIDWFGAVTVKGTTLRPRHGNCPPRIWETPSGLLNSIGLQNPGVDEVITHYLPQLAQFDVPIIVNISGETYEEFQEIAKKLADCPHVTALEVNVSCPNVESGGMAFGTDPGSCYRATKAVRRSWPGPLIVKLTPNVTNISEMAKAAVDAGATCVSLINTLLGMAIDIQNKRPALGNIKGGLSGPAVKPVAVRCVWEVFQSVSVPVIGMGGVFSWEDALEFIMAGASAVALGTAVLVDPYAPKKIVDGIQSYCESNGIDSMSSIVGIAQV
ncbi:MAG TPA: dihydroorotate dehydrogenase [Bacillota bacterium]|nr:dihydroorotate dehydrogenase [Candidatus Fermentithermobacillaceae bacterium]HOB29964.1 dihydroorotate dehydrogenase [Bacillota bacterium]HOK63835.1 dihydroorotate dehydrogenase [Bacillota bacterium]HOQ03207.1 dihydroorotate dehydrogenase [Bacillota bacterium]HPP60382.1 dihydroorotate dehydrogenase [Bacillota bacterium]